jgi:MSHA pilin protein MshC
MRRAGRFERGFTIIEIVVVLILLGIIAAFVGSRMFASNTDVIGQAGAIKNALRYSQSMAMKYNAIWGMKCDGADYWVFRTNSPDVEANQMVLPGESTAKIGLASRKVSMGNLTIFFDGSGIPYTSYTNANTNTPLAAAMNVTVTQISSGAGVNITITPDTGFVP